MLKKIGTQIELLKYLKKNDSYATLIFTAPVFKSRGHLLWEAFLGLQGNRFLLTKIFEQFVDLSLEACNHKFPTGDYRIRLGIAFADSDILTGVKSKDDGGKRVTSPYYLGLALTDEGR